MAKSCVRLQKIKNRLLLVLPLPHQSEVAYRLQNHKMQEIGIIARDCLPAARCLLSRDHPHKPATWRRLPREVADPPRIRPAGSLTATQKVFQQRWYFSEPLLARQRSVDKPLGLLCGALMTTGS